MGEGKEEDELLSTYTTTQGEGWDEVALKVYGSELYSGVLMQANPSHLETFIFSAGEVLEVPDLPEEEDDTTPEWRKLSDGGAAYE